MFEEEKEKDETEELDLFGVGSSIEEDDDIEKIDDLEDDVEDDEAYMSEFDDSDEF